MAILERRYVTTAAFNGTTLGVDYPGYLSQHDVVYNAPPRQGEEGLPIGDGDLAAMVWCPPGEIRLQINKSGLWWENPYARGDRPADYLLLSAGGLSIRTDPSPFTDPEQFEQRLCLFQGAVHLMGSAPETFCQAQAWVAATGNVLCIQYSDMLLRGRSRTVELHVWRRGHPFALGEHIGLVESLPDRRFALVCRVIGEGVQAGWKDARTPKFEIIHGRSTKFTVLVAAAITDLESDPVRLAKGRLDAALRMGVNLLYQQHKQHWRAFWQRSFLRLASPDGLADYLENLWYLYFYQLACCSRSLDAPLENGGLWLTHRDQRPGGAVYRHRNTQILYWPTFAANHLDLTGSYFTTYLSQLPVLSQQTQERFHAGGIFMPEVVNRRGEAVGPPQPSTEGGAMTTALDCAMLFWWYWKLTQDYMFLQSQAYPLLKLIVHFYASQITPENRFSPLLYAGSASAGAPSGSLEEIGSLRYVLSALIEASEILEEDASERQRWEHVLRSLPEAPFPPGKYIWWEGDYDPEALSSLRPHPCVEVGTNTETPEYLQAVRDLQALFPLQNLPADSIAPLIAARHGLGREAVSLLQDQIERFQAFTQGFFHCREDPGEQKAHPVPSLAPMAILAATLNEICVQAHNGIIQLFPALPPGWEASFSLYTSEGFQVMAESRGGSVIWAAVQTYNGGLCRLQNPWNGVARVLDGRFEMSRSSESVLQFHATRGVVYAIDRPDHPLSRTLRARLSGRRNTGAKRLGNRQIGLP